ncbi:uncharacterized protein [Linepithema humile]|uniref:uncharacterized protein n=1 Tax=Linepithema humile TaxID=83485 RepID=UPI00351E0CE2
MLQFIVVKFLPTAEDDNVYYEVALAKWLVQIDKNMIGKILWPKNNSIAGKLVRSEARADETWQQLEVEVKRYYETYIAARNAARGFEQFASAYESDSGCQMGRGMRRKRFINPFSSDDDSSSSDRSKKCKQDKSKSKIPAAPLPPPFAANSSPRKSLNIALKENINPLIVVSNKKQGKTVTAPTTASVKQNKLLHKIINLRQQAADKAQQRKKAMSLENIYKLPVKMKVVHSTLCSEPLEQNFETNESCKSDSQSSSIVSSLNMQLIEESSLGNEMFNDTQSGSFYQSPSNKIQNPIQIQRPCNLSTISDIHQKSSRELNEFATEEIDETDSLTLSQTASTNWNTGLVLYIL